MLRDSARRLFDSQIPSLSLQLEMDSFVAHRSHTGAPRTPWAEFGLAEYETYNCCFLARRCGTQTEERGFTVEATRKSIGARYKVLWIRSEELDGKEARVDCSSRRVPGISRANRMTPFLLHIANSRIPYLTRSFPGACPGLTCGIPKPPLTPGESS